MSSTTLMTFLLCTGPHVRSVKLLGSWDNFSKPYVMERDKRVGAGQWRGCHTFTNIVCDGVSHSAPARSGGLKMGGTYWYYYLLDDEVEHYNSAEPMTTRCPFLPGQPVNVLHVPIILPDTNPPHTRARSPSAQRTERTMNPEDKYMNPREPPKPRLQLRTSPPLLQTPAPNWSFSTSPLGSITNRGASQPSHGVPRIKHPRVNEKAARSVSPPRSRGFRAALRQWNGSSPNLSPTINIEKGMPIMADHRSLRPQNDDRLHVRSQSNDSYMRSPSIGPMPEALERDDLPLRRPVSVGAHDSTSLSIQERRALDTKTPDVPTPRNPLTLKSKQSMAIINHIDGQPARTFLATRPLSTPSTPSMPKRPSTKPLILEESYTSTPMTVMNKRLPTLPNSPSSVMDEALRDLENQEKGLDMEALASHFSDLTETQSVSADNRCEMSRFSEWSTDNELVSPESMTSSSTFNERQDSPIIPAMDFSQLSEASGFNETSDLNTPHLTVGSNSFPLPEDSPQIDIPLPRLTITLSPSNLSIPGLYIDDEEELLESNPKRHAAFFEAMEIKGLGLTSPPATTIRFPEDVQDVIPGDKSIIPTNDASRYRTSMFLSRSAAMKEMLDELSYLKNMIQSGAAPEM